MPSRPQRVRTGKFDAPREFGRRTACVSDSVHWPPSSRWPPISTDPADARGRRKRHHGARAYNPPYAAIVVDANSGQRAARRQCRRLRHPASLTKIMTLYLLFEQIEAGKLRLDSRLEVSEHASQQAPSKLGLRPGPDPLGRGRDPRAGHQVGERCGGRGRGSDRRRRRDLRPHDDAQGARARHEPHGLRQCVRPARRGPAHHRARSGDARPRHPGPLPALLPLFRDAELRLSRPRDAQSQQAARPRARASTASRPATPAPRASTSCPRCGAAIATSSRWCSAAPPAARATRACACLIEQHIASASTQRTVAKIAESDGGRGGAAKAATAGHRSRRCRRASRAPTRCRRSPSRSRRREAHEPAAAPAASQTAAPLAAPALSRQPKPGSGEPINPVKVKTITVKAGNVQTAMLVPLIAPRRRRRVAPPHFAKNAQSRCSRRRRRAPVRACSACCRSKRCRPPSLAAVYDRRRRRPPCRSRPRRPRRAAASARPLDHPGRRVPEGNRSAGAPARGADRWRKTLSPRPSRSPRGSSRAARSSTAPASPASTRTAPKPPASTSSATTSPAWRSRTSEFAANSGAASASGPGPGAFCCDLRPNTPLSERSSALAKPQSVSATVRAKNKAVRAASVSEYRSR